MQIENLITKRSRLDRRYKITHNISQWVNRNTLAAATWGFIIGSLSGAYIADRPATSQATAPKPQEQKIEIKPVTVEAKETPFCFDPITCIRDIGEEMGFSNQEIITAIKIGKCESGLNPQAVAYEPNGTYSFGVMQLNDVHGKRISRQDRLDFEKNIRFAWTLRKEQGHWGAWSCYKLINK
jgi:hypothetical protein